MEKKSYAEFIIATVEKNMLPGLLIYTDTDVLTTGHGEGIAHLCKGKGVDTGSDAIWWPKASTRDL